MRKLSYIFYIVIPPIYAFFAAQLLTVLYQYTERTYSNAFLFRMIIPAIIFMGFGIFMLWKSTSKHIKSLTKKYAIYLVGVSLLIQFMIICFTIWEVHFMLLMNSNAILMIYISFGFDLGMLVYNIRRES